MSVSWSDFLLIAGAVTELIDAIRYFTARGKQHHKVLMAAKKYRKVLKNPVFAKLIKDGRTELKIFKLFPFLYPTKNSH